jgi:hypothetical protein
VARVNPCSGRNQGEWNPSVELGRLGSVVPARGVCARIVNAEARAHLEVRGPPPKAGLHLQVPRVNRLLERGAHGGLVRAFPKCTRNSRKPKPSNSSQASNRGLPVAITVSVLPATKQFFKKGGTMLLDHVSRPRDAKRKPTRASAWRGTDMARRSATTTTSTTAAVILMTSACAAGQAPLLKQVVQLLYAGTCVLRLRQPNVLARVHGSVRGTKMQPKPTSRIASACERPVVADQQCRGAAPQGGM